QVPVLPVRAVGQVSLEHEAALAVRHQDQMPDVFWQLVLEERPQRLRDVVEVGNPPQRGSSHLRRLVLEALDQQTGQLGVVGDQAVELRPLIRAGEESMHEHRCDVVKHCFPTPPTILEAPVSWVKIPGVNPRGNHPDGWYTGTGRAMY